MKGDFITSKKDKKLPVIQNRCQILFTLIYNYEDTFDIKKLYVKYREV